MQLYLVSFHAGNLGLFHSRLVARAGGEELVHFAFQRLEVEHSRRVVVDGEALDFHGLLRGSGLRVQHFESVVLWASRNEARDVGAGPVAFQLIRQVAQEAAGGKVESVLRARQVDDGV